MLNETVRVTFTPEQLGIAFVDGDNFEQARFIRSVGNSISCMGVGKWPFQCRAISDTLEYKEGRNNEGNEELVRIAISGLEDLIDHLKEAMLSHHADKPLKGTAMKIELNLPEEMAVAVDMLAVFDDITLEAAALTLLDVGINNTKIHILEKDNDNSCRLEKNDG